MNDTWFADIEPYVFTYCKYNLADKDGAKFPDLYCTTADERLPTRLPAVSIREISQKERGQDLDNADVNAVLSTFEVKAYALTDEECRAISSASAVLMKELRFNAISMPIYDMEENLYASYARYRRIIGAGDTDITSWRGY